MITMKRVNKYHILVLDTKTDKSHLVAIEDESKTPILSFDSSLNCFDRNGKIIGHIKSDKDQNWIMPNNFGFEIEPVPQYLAESTFTIEAQFCQKWLELQKQFS